MIFLELIVLSILCGVLGRMGGAGESGQWYDKLLGFPWRKAGCSLVVTFTWWLLLGQFAAFWWIYIIVFGLHWAAFSTYWDWLFKFDNMWFSGFIVGLASLPLMIIIHWLWIPILIRAIMLAVIWGLNNKYLPGKVFFWNRDVAEEFIRYSMAV